MENRLILFLHNVLWSDIRHCVFPLEAMTEACCGEGSWKTHCSPQLESLEIMLNVQMWHGPFQ
jgi:hypothetical protein